MLPKLEKRFKPKEMFQKKKKTSITKFYDNYTEQLLSRTSEFCNGLNQRFQKEMTWLKRYKNYV